MSRDKSQTSRVDFKLDTLYINTRWLAQLAGDEAVRKALSFIPYGESTDRMVEHARYGAAGRVLRQWLIDNWLSVEPLETMLLRGEAKPGRIFTTQRDFYCRNMAPRSRPSRQIATLTAKYEAPAGVVALTLEGDREHLAPGSPGHWLSGHRGDLFVVGLIKEVKPDAVLGAPIFIGHMLAPSADVMFLAEPAWRPELHPEDIDAFARCAGQESVRDYELKKLRSIPEAQIKSALAELIGEDFLPKDWGGEMSDLFTSRVTVGGRRLSTAFLLKGPAKFHPMTLRDLGSNGDQIVRLFSEPAELYVLQHCHRVANGIRSHMKAFSLRPGDQRRFCIIDGYDTLRILRAYEKCGQLSKPMKPRPPPRDEEDPMEPSEPDEFESQDFDI